MTQPVRAEVLALVLVLGTALLPAPGAGAQESTDADAAPEDMEEIVVTGSRLVREPVTIDPVGSATTLGRELLERDQPQDIYEALLDVPGVSFDGGPRTNGRTFVIRGFSDNEDVSVQIDGASQNFEKYRFGSAVAIEPDLLREVEVVRGAARISEGVGSLGGLVRARTVSASEFLDRDQRLGGRIRAGYQTNDDGHELSATAAARPFGWLDVLASTYRRDSNDFELPDGSRLADSSQSNESQMLKVDLFSRHAELALTWRRADNESLEPFDATGGGPGVGGTVRRTSQETSTALNGSFVPGPEWINITGTLAQTRKTVIDEDSAIAGQGTDTIDYDVLTAGLRNAFSLPLGPFTIGLEAGAQFNLEDRVSIRENARGRAENEAQPSGVKRNLGVFVEPSIAYGGLTITGGLRRDMISIDPGANSARLLRAQGRREQTRYWLTTPAATVSYQFWDDRLTAFYSYAEAFRPPLIDELYTTGTLSRCQYFSGFRPPPVAPTLPAQPPPAPVAPVVADFPDLAAYLLALDAYLVALDAWNAALLAFDAALDAYFVELDEFLVASQAYPDDPLARLNAQCADLYKPERSRNHEVGLSLQLQDLLLAGDSFTSRLVLFDTRVSNVLESIYENSVTGEIDQPGTEQRRGIEFELAWDARRWFANLSWNHITGKVLLNYFENNANPLVNQFTTPEDREGQPLLNVAPHTLAFSFGHRVPAWSLDVGYRMRAVAARTVTTGIRPGCPAGVFSLPACLELGEQSGYVLHAFFAGWQPTDRTRLRLTVSNAFNRQYELPGFSGGTGTLAPGRDVRLSLEWKY